MDKRTETNILFAVNTTYSGKFGITKAKGLKIINASDSIMIYPITINDDIGDICIRVLATDLSAIDQIINGLIAAKDNILTKFKHTVKFDEQDLNPTDSHDGC